MEGAVVNDQFIDELYRDYAEELHRYCAMQFHFAPAYMPTVDDIVQEVFIKAYRVYVGTTSTNAETGQKTTAYMTLQEAAAAAERSYSWAANVHRLALLHVQAIIDARRLEPLAMLKTEDDGNIMMERMSIE